MGTLGASISSCSVFNSGIPFVSTEATPPVRSGTAACCHSLWRPFPIDLPVPLRCHLSVIVGQVVAGAHCSASMVGAFGSICAILYDGFPLVRLLSLAQAAAPPDLSPTLRSNGDAAQMGISLIVPLLLQVWSQSADVGAGGLPRLGS